MDKYTILKKYFGYSQFRKNQLEIIDSVLEGKDTFVLMATGGGKSLCFQIPALCMDGLTIVISPLIALMKDQVDNLKQNGIPAEFLNSTLSTIQVSSIQTRIKNNKIKLLYISPERLALKSFQSFLSTVKISLFVVDEVHCISEWGHEFRKDYRKLRVIKKLWPTIPIIALTATASQIVQTDIKKQLGLAYTNNFTTTCLRPNLQIIVKQKREVEQIVELVQKYKGESVIIYCFSRNDTERIANTLQHNSHRAVTYHGGLTKNQRATNQQKFITDNVQIVVATLAFGMGIDKSNVRLVIHTTFPKSIAGYYQEIGRAGRDGLASTCVLLYSQQDYHQHQYFLRRNPRLKKDLDLMVKFCEGIVCRNKILLDYFGEKIDKCQNCDICLGIKEEIIVEKQPTQLVKKLKELRKNIADEENISLERVFSSQTLLELVTKKPQTKQELMHINGLNITILHNYGDDILQICHVKKNMQKPVNVLLGSLKELRTKIAVTQNISSELVFSDSTLEELSLKKPTTLAEFAVIKGISEEKAKKYGVVFVSFIKNSVLEDILIE